MSTFIRNVLKNGKFRVLFSAVTANLLYIGTGATLSYPSPAVPNINANRNPFHVNTDEQSWVGSMYLLGYTIGGFVCGTVSDALGRKLAMIFATVLCIVGFTIVSSAMNVLTMYAGLLLIGFFNAINTTAVVLYSSEIATPDNRGILVSLFGMLSNVGAVVVYLAGSYLSWNWLAIFNAALYAYPILILVFLPESPRWFLLKGNKEAAAHGLRWFRSEDANNAGIDAEVEIIEQSLVGASKGMSAIKDLFQWKYAKSVFICFVLYIVEAFCGTYTILVFTVTIFQLANVNIDPNLQSVVTGLFSLIGSVFCLVLIERWGRRPLLIFSTLFTAVGSAMVAAFFQVQNFSPDFATQHLFWLPLCGVSLVLFMYGIGLATIPWVFACELFPTNVRGTVQAVSNVSSTLAQFVAIKTFSNIQTAIGTSGAFWLYTACGVAGIIFIVLVVKEPKQKILD